jgi:phosphatidylglycerol:prolipoprotein diacylglycerol transferase
MYPKLLDVGPVTIHTYGLLLAVAFISGIWLASRNAKKGGLNPDSIWNMGLIIIFAALIGAKLLLFISDYAYYLRNPGEIFSLSTLRSTGVFYGGLLLALAAAAWYLRRSGLPGWKVADYTAPGIALGHSIGRLGCFSAGCCYGKPTDLPWGVTFTSQYAHDNVGIPLNISLHPTQLYESLGTMILFLYLMFRLNRKHFAGQIVLEYLIIYAALRFFIEFFRNDERGFLFSGLLSTSQFVGVLTILVSVFLFLFLKQRSTRTHQN